RQRRGGGVDQRRDGTGKEWQSLTERLAKRHQGASPEEGQRLVQLRRDRRERELPVVVAPLSFEDLPLLDHPRELFLGRDHLGQAGGLPSEDLAQARLGVALGTETRLE